MTKACIAIIGAGSLGTCLLSGLIKNKYPADKIWITNPSTKKLVDIKNQFNVHTTTNNMEAVKQADVVIFTVKPFVLNQVVSELAEIVQNKKPLILSAAAGISESSISNWLGGNVPIVRAMPNTPAVIGRSATALYANSFVTNKLHALAESIFRAVGVTVWISDEKLMDVITALSGCGPAYFFLTIEILQNVAIELGLPPETARLLILQTAFGASALALESDIDVIELRQRVASPGGTTEAALKVLEESNIRGIFKAALEKAKARSSEIAALFGKSTES